MVVRVIGNVPRQTERAPDSMQLAAECDVRQLRGGGASLPECFYLGNFFWR